MYILRSIICVFNPLSSLCIALKCNLVKVVKR